jgi:hypothetical protein
VSDARGVARCWAGFASLGAGLVHLAVVQEHFEESALFGAFFLVSGALQIGWAMVALARDRMPLPRLVAAGQLAMVVLWAVTRTVGLPVGPDVWTPEAVGRADVLCVALELVSAGAVAAWIAQTRASGQTMRSGRYLALVGAGALVVAAMTAPALAATGGGEHMDPNRTDEMHGAHGSDQTARALPNGTVRTWAGG